MRSGETEEGRIDFKALGTAGGICNEEGEIPEHGPVYAVQGERAFSPVDPERATNLLNLSYRMRNRGCNFPLRKAVNLRASSWVVA